MDPNIDNEDAEGAAVHEPRLWVDNGWTAKVIKNEDDDGWAVAMTRDGEREPALVGPWTMGRDKKNPKPLDVNAFNTLVKTASEVIRRHEQAQHAGGDPPPGRCAPVHSFVSLDRRQAIRPRIVAVFRSFWRTG